MRTNHLLITLNMLILLLLLLKLQKLIKIRRAITIRRWWVKPHLYPHIRDVVGGYQTIFMYFKLHDEEEFIKLIGMSIGMYNTLFTLVQRRLQKSSRRKPLNADLRLAVVLSFLHQGGDPKTFAIFYRIGKCTIYKLIKDVCFVIQDVLRPIYFPVLNKVKWLEISHQYSEKWNMPNCLGALDGRHFCIKKPPHSGSIYFNYKNYFSIVLLAMCDAFRRFTWFNLGDFGSVNDASIFNNSDLCEKMNNGSLEIPPPSLLPRSDIKMPYFLIGDNIFALQKHLMNPYRIRNDMTLTQKIFNYRLKRARLTIECTFGILVSKWKILQKSYGFKMKTFENIIVALMCLHNMLITENLQENNEFLYMEEDEIQEVEDENVRQLQEREVNHNTAAKRQRNLLAQYFVSDEGSIPWQNECI